jgi:hypothetical protein
VAINRRKKHGFCICTHLSTSAATRLKILCSHILILIRHRITFLEHWVQGTLKICFCSLTHPHRCSQELYLSTVRQNKLEQNCLLCIQYQENNSMELSPWDSYLLSTSKNSLPFMEPGGSLLCSQEPTYWTDDFKSLISSQCDLSLWMLNMKSVTHVIFI